MGRSRNGYIGGTAQVEHYEDKVREASLRWFGHVDGRDSGYAGQRALHIKLSGRRKSERLKRRFMDVITCRGLL